MGKLVLKSKKVLDDIKEEAKKGGRAEFFQPEFNEKGIFKVFICPPRSEEHNIVSKVVVFEAFNKNGLLGKVNSPANWGEKEPFTKLSYSLEKKYKEVKGKKEFYKYLRPKTKNCYWVIDPTNEDKGIQLWQAPYSVSQFILNDIETNDGDMDFAHPQTGRLLVVKKTGSGLDTEYNQNWSKVEANLSIDEDKLVEMLEELPEILGGIFKKPSKDDIEEYKETMEGIAERLGIPLNWNGKSQASNDEELGDEVEDVKSSKKSSSKGKAKDEDDDLDLDDNSGDDDDLDLDEVEDTKSSKKSSTKTDSKGKNKPKDEDDDLDLDDID